MDRRLFRCLLLAVMLIGLPPLALVPQVTTATPEGSWSSTGDMNGERFQFPLVRLKDGRVLSGGGMPAFSVGFEELNTADLYDHATGIWTGTGVMASKRTGHTATLLGNGKVLIAGGRSIDTPQTTAEMFDPALNGFAGTGSMSVSRMRHAAVRLPDGRVLVAGGQSDDSSVSSSAEIYDPATGL